MATPSEAPESPTFYGSADGGAYQTFQTLDRANLFALVFRTNNMKTPAGRARKIAALVDMLARGDVVVPMSPPRGATTRAGSAKPKR